MLEMANRISFVKDNTSIIESEFWEAYTLAKQYKVYSKKRLIDTTDIFYVRLYADLFVGKNTLLAGGYYQYGAMFINEATCMRFPITMKSKDAIYKENKAVFNKIEIDTDKKMQDFR